MPKYTGSVTTVESLSVELNPQTGTAYTLVLADAGRLVTVDSAALHALTLPPNSSVAFDIGTYLTIAQLGVGQIQVTPGSGVTLVSRGSVFKTAGQYAMATLMKIATDTWILSGDIVA